MKFKVYLSIAVIIVWTCGIAMFISYIQDKIHYLFGDEYMTTSRDYNNNIIKVHGYWEWSITHYWFLVMCILLALLSLVHNIILISSIIKKQYPDL